MKPTILQVDSVESTNSVLSEMSKEQVLESGFVLWADEQCSGRGQMGTAWQSEPGKNLTFSIFIRWKDFPVEEQFLFQQMISLSLVYILESYGIRDLKVKWPNDIYHKDSKIAGILVENSLSGFKIDSGIIGIGLNVNQLEFNIPGKRICSMKMILNEDINRTELIQKIASDLLFKSRNILKNKEVYQSSYLEQLYHGEGLHWYMDHKKNRFRASIAGIDSNGKLILQKEDGAQASYGLKELSFLND